MIFEHLQESLSQPFEYAQKANGTSYKSVISWSQRRQGSLPEYWESVLEGFNESGYVFPLSLQSTPTTTSTLTTSWSRGTMKKSKFTMATIAHRAWAISLGNMSGLHDVLFATVLSSRYHSIPSVESAFGPVVFLAPVRTKFEEEQSLGDYLQSMQTQLASMIRPEQDGYRFGGRLVSLPQLRQSYLSWHPHGDDKLSKDLTFKDCGGLAVKLKPRRDLSTPFAGNSGLVLNIYEQENSLDFYTSWDDSLRDQSEIEQLMADFIHNLDQLGGSSPLTVADLWPGTGRKWAY